MRNNIKSHQVSASKSCSQAYSQSYSRAYWLASENQKFLGCQSLTQDGNWHNLSFLSKIILAILAIILVLSSSGCMVLAPNNQGPGKEFKQDLENASPDFKQGWADGCESGMSGGGNSFKQRLYKVNKQDGYKFTYSPDYKTAWGYAFWFCYRVEGVDQKSTAFSSMFKGYI